MRHLRNDLSVERSQVQKSYLENCNDRRLHLEVLEARVVLSAVPLESYSELSSDWFADVASSTSSSLSTSSEESSPADRWIVRLKAESLSSTTTVEEAAQWVTTDVPGMEVLRGLGLPGLMLVVTPGLDASEVTEAFSNNPDIAYFEQDSTVYGAQTPDDPSFVEQASLDNTGQDGGLLGADIDAEAAWNISTGDRGVVSAVIDSGIDYTHSDLALNIWINQGEIPAPLLGVLNHVDSDGLITFVDLNDPLNAAHVTDDNMNGFIDAGDLLVDPAWADGVDNDGNTKLDDLFGWDFRNDDNNPFDDHGHGTHVSGTLGAVGNNANGVAGVAWTSSIMALKFLGDDNTGLKTHAMEAIEYATQMRTDHGVNVRVMNNSWTTNSSSNALRDAIAASETADILFVAAAGNGNNFGGVDNDNLPSYPASYGFDNIISVAASNRIDNLAYFSNFGETSVDLAAPGVGIKSTEISDDYSSRSGSSMAAPHVSGVAALLFSNVPGATSAEVKAAILGGVDQVTSLQDKVVSDGRLNAFGALGLDTFSPKPVLDSAQDITDAGTTPQTIVVTFTDDTAIDVSTLDEFDVIVTRLDGSGDTFATTFQSVDVPSNGPVRIAQYEMLAPGGDWDPADNGDYEISVVAGQVSDTTGLVSLATVIGTFNVDVNNPGEFFVDSPLDTPDALPGDGIAKDNAGNRTLRAAIQESNAMMGDNTIFVAAGTFTLSIASAGEDLAATTGDLDITDTAGTLTIVGAGADKTFIDAAGLDRIFDVRPGTTVSLSGVTLLGGNVMGDGGAILVDGSMLTIADSAITDSQATGNGGGLYVSSGPVVDVVRSTISGNQAGTDGGGIANAGTLTVTNSTFSGNTATGEGGGLHNASTGTATIESATFTANSANEGGGIFQDGGLVNVHNTIVAVNTATTNPDVTGSFTSLNNNLIGDVGSATGFGAGTGDIVGSLGSEIDPMLSPLQDNTGTTLTHVPLPGSPAIDSGDDTGAPVTDQRQVPRPQDGDDDSTTQVDIGAVERFFATISGVHFHDLDGNEVQNGAEPGLAGWTIYVDVNQNQQFDAGEPFAITASDGSYTIGGVVPGSTYQVRVVLQEGWEQTAPLAITDIFNVTSLVDGADANLGDGVNLDQFGNQTLRAAIQEANVSSGVDTIMLGPGIHPLTITGSAEEAALTGDLDITDHVNIVGAGADVTIIDASGLGDRVFDILGSQLVNVTGVTITGGTGTGTGINASGGGIRNGGVLTLQSSAIGNNTSVFKGGGLANLSNSVVTIVDSTFSNNMAQRGGGVHNEGTVTVTNSTFSANTTDTGTDRRGGAIYQTSGSLTVEASTITGNTADQEAGGVYVQAGTATSINTVIAANLSNSTGSLDASGAFTSLGNNLIGEIIGATGFSNGVNGDQVGGIFLGGIIDPMLGPLQNNGGTTLTHEPMTGSPLIDAGNNTQALTLDQRGRRRIIDGDADSSDVVDIGSLEFFDGFIVNTTADTVDVLPGDGLAEDAGGNTSLRAAIMEANALAGDQSILLDAETYALSITGTEMGDASAGDLDVTDTGGSLTIFGASASQTVIDASGIDRVLDVSSSVTLTLRDLAITGGSATASGEEDGGGIYNDGGTITLTRVSLSNNTAAEAGGGIYQASGNLTITDSTIEGNSASSVLTGGGGLFSYGGLVDIDRSTLSGNSALNGGGAFANAGTVTIESSTISGNMATSLGGGMVNQATLSILYSTVTDNKADSDDVGGGSGGGLYAVTGSMSLQHTIVAGNTRQTASPTPDDISGSTVTGSFNLIGDAATSGALTDGANGNIVGDGGTGTIDPMLAPLADNGGPTQTHAILGGSPAIDAGDPSAMAGVGNVPQLDQRDFNRVEDGDGYLNATIDIGAYEFVLSPVAPGTILIVDEILDESDGDVGVGELSLREALFLSNISAGVQTITFDASLDGLEIDLLLGELPITDAATIDASSLTGGLTIDAQLNSRIFNITATGDFTFAGLTLTGGRTTGDNGNVFDTTFSGGAIRSLTSGNLTIDQSTITGSGTTGYGADGGGIFASGDITLTDSTISSNSTSYSGGEINDPRGGGIYAMGNVTLTGSTISGNSTVGSHSADGGAVFASGNVTLTNSTVSGNSAAGESAGGGIRAMGDVSLTNSTLSGNSAGGNSGGGGIHAMGDVTVTYSTIINNHANHGGGTGGGIWNDNDTITITGSIIAGNTAGFGNPDLNPGTGTLAVNFSLIGTGIIPTSGANNVSTDSPLLAPLAANGGPTETHALLPASPAIDAGDPAAVAGMGSVPAFDQRGMQFDRVGGARIDMGAYEAQPQVYTVDTLVDEDDVDYSAGDFSLREAIGLANSSAGSDTINFDASLDGETILVGLGELGLIEAVTIDASSLTGGLTIDAQQNSRIFNITATNGDFTFTGLTLTGGKTTAGSESGGAIRSLTSGNLAIDQSHVGGNSTEGSYAGGGALFATGGVTLTNSTVTGNSTTANGSKGGGISAGGDVTLTNSTISSNSTAGYGAEGGGIVASDVTVTNSTISANSTANHNARGGGISASSANLSNSTVSGNSTISGNSSFGGGIFVSGDVTLTDSTVSGNSTSGLYGHGGGISADGNVTLTGSTVSSNSTSFYSSRGGGINSSGDVTLTDSTVSGNSTSGDFADGGGIFASGNVSLTGSTVSGNTTSGFQEAYGGGIRVVGSVTLTNSTITDNHAYYSGSYGGGIFSSGTTTITGSIVAGNTAGAGNPDLFSLTPTVTTYSLIGDNAGTNLIEAQTPDASGNLIGSASGGGTIDPILAPLAANGGLTETHALLVGSPALDTGDPATTFNPAEFDQRGNPFVRVFDGDAIPGARIDMGAYERQSLVSSFFVVDTLADELDNDYSLGDVSLREAIDGANGSVGSDTITFDASLDAGAILLALGELLINEDLTIDATSLTGGLTIDAQSNSRIFNITTTAGDVAIAGLTLTGGQTIADSESGGAIRSLTNGVLAISGSTISANSTQGNSAPGGGVHALGNVTLTDSTISGNSTIGSGADGGGIYVNGNVTLTQSTLSGNTTAGSGSDGGGIYAAGDVTLAYSTITDNHANDGSAYGGGIWNDDDTVTISGSIVAGNTAGGDNPDLKPGTGTLDVDYSLIGDNAGTSLSEAQTPDAFGNLIGSTVGSGTIDPLLGPLTNNGGLTETHALLTGSPAIDAGDPSAIAGVGNVPQFDQRGLNRVEDGDGILTATIDIGSFELAAGAPLSAFGADSSGDTVSTSSDGDGMQISQALLAAVGGGEFAPLLSPAIGIPGFEAWTVTVGPGDAFENIDFGVRALPGEIRGQKFHDLDADGVKDSFESGLSGWEIYLDDNNNQMYDAGVETLVATDTDGIFVFPNLPSEQTYIVAEVAQTGWVQTFPTDNGGRHTILLGAGEIVSDVDFGNVEDNAGGVGTGDIQGLLFSDANGNGIQDGGDTGLSGETVYLDLNDNGAFDGGEPTTVTTVTGTYEFLGVTTGEYAVRVILPSEGTQSFPQGVDNRPQESTLPTGTQPSSLVAGDFNRDGHLDLAVVNAGSTSLSIFTSDTVGSFLPPMVINLSTAPLSIQAAQFNDDNGDMQIDENDYVDLIVGYSGTNFISILFNDQIGGFTNSNFTTPFYAPWFSAPGDFDNDGDNDVVTVHLNQSSVSFLERFPGGFVSPAPTIANGQDPASLIAVQLTDDNSDLVVDAADRLDLAWVDILPGANTVTFLLNNGGGSFAPPVTRSVGGRPYAVAAGDFDGDGFNDLAVTVPETNQVAVLINNQSGNFLPTVFTSAGLDPTAISAGDLDDDGDTDLAVTNASDEGFVILRNDGTGQFTAEVSGVGAFPNPLAVGIVAAQLDNDPSLDLAIASGFGAESVLFFANRLVDRAQRVTVQNGTATIGVDFGITLPSADFDGDSDVDGFDFLAWQLGLGTPSPNATKADGDADNDLDVDNDDLTVWETQYGQSAPLAAASSSPQVEASSANERLAVANVSPLEAQVETSEQTMQSDAGSFMSQFTAYSQMDTSLEPAGDHLSIVSAKDGIYKSMGMQVSPSASIDRRFRHDTVPSSHNDLLVSATDAALAIDWMDDRTEDEELLPFDQFNSPVVTRNSPLALLINEPAARVAMKLDSRSAKFAEDEDTDEQWLTDRLLERVFG